MRPVSPEAIGVHRQMADIGIGETQRKTVDIADRPGEAEEQSVAVPMTRRSRVRVEVMADLHAEDRAIELGIGGAVPARHRMCAPDASPRARQYTCPGEQ